MSEDSETPWLCDWEPGGGPAPLGIGETRVYRVDLNPEPGVDRLEGLASWEILSDEERARAARFLRFRDGRRFAVCRGALRAILGGLAGSPAAAVAFRFGPGGKPELGGAGRGDATSRPRFNVSHSDELALIAVDARRELGVDIERDREISQADRIVASYFTPAELAEFDSLPAAARASAFLRGWTRKEAVLKARGVGLAGLATEFETLFGTSEIPRAFAPASPLPRLGELRLWEASPRPGYVAALAVRDPDDATPQSTGPAAE